MNLNLYSLLAYLKYLRTSRTRHSIHSPFVFTLVEEVFRNKTLRPELDDIVGLHEILKQNTRLLEITDFGTAGGSRGFIHRFSSISTIARKSSMDYKYGKLLFELVNWFKPQIIIELGACLGLSAAYMAKAAPNAKIYTVEGCATKSQQAASNCRKLNISNVDVQIGSFEIVLPQLINSLGKVDFVFLDGDHSYRPTIQYFEMLLRIAHNDTVIVLDDIHWSDEMTDAWNRIKEHERVTVSIDLFRMGLIFLKKELSKQQFVIRY